MAIQYYRTSQGNYQLDKATGVASKVVSIPAGSSVIDWGASNLPPELQNALGQERTSIGQTLGFSPNIAYGATNTPTNYTPAPTNSSGGRYVENPGLLKGMTYEQAKAAIARQEGWPTIEEQWSTDRQNQVSETIQRAGISKPATYNQNPENIEKQIEAVVESIIASNKTINPNLKYEDLAGITIEEFMRQAELAIVPQYKEKFQTIKDNLTRELTNIGYDLGLKKEENIRTTQKNLDTGEEQLADRGLAFSGQREQFTKDTADSLTRANEAARTLAFRNAQERGTAAESTIGTSALQGMNLPSIEGRSPFAFSSAPLVGSDVYGQRTNTANYAQGLETKARDILTNYPSTDRSTITRALGFA